MLGPSLSLTYPYCFWTNLLGSLPVLRAHSFASNWQLPFLNQRKGENGRRNYFMTNLHERTFLYVRIKPATVHIPGRRASDRATAPGAVRGDSSDGVYVLNTTNCENCKHELILYFSHKTCHTQLTYRVSNYLSWQQKIIIRDNLYWKSEICSLGLKIHFELSIVEIFNYLIY